MKKKVAPLKNKEVKKEKSLEKMYLEIIKSFRYSWPEISDERTLEQPHAYPFIESITTYGEIQKQI